MPHRLHLRQDTQHDGHWVQGCMGPQGSQLFYWSPPPSRGHTPWIFWLLLQPAWLTKNGCIILLVVHIYFPNHIGEQNMPTLLLNPTKANMIRMFWYRKFWRNLNSKICWIHSTLYDHGLPSLPPLGVVLPHHPFHQSKPCWCPWNHLRPRATSGRLVLSP